MTIRRSATLALVLSALFAVGPVALANEDPNADASVHYDCYDGSTGQSYACPSPPPDCYDPESGAAMPCPPPPEPQPDCYDGWSGGTNACPEPEPHRDCYDPSTGEFNQCPEEVCEWRSDGTKVCWHKDPPPPEPQPTEPQCEKAQDSDVYYCKPPEAQTTDPYRCEPSADGTTYSCSSPPEAQPAEPQCEKAPDSDAYICKPPPSCDGRLYTTPECTPPPECARQRDGTFLCKPQGEPKPAGDESQCVRYADGSTRCAVQPACPVRSDGSYDCTYQKYDDGPQAAPPARPADAEPACKPATSPDAAICAPPRACEGKMYATPECTPPKECSDNGDGTFTCNLRTAPRGAHEGCTSEECDFGDDDLFEGEEDFVVHEARRELKRAVEHAMEAYRSGIHELRAEYRSGIADLRSIYAESKEGLRIAFDACLDDVPEGSRETERAQARRVCITDAREGLAALREALLAERATLREELVAEAEDVKFGTCLDLEAEVFEILVDFDLEDANLPRILGPHDLRFCAGILFEFETGDGALSGSGGAGAPEPVPAGGDRAQPSAAPAREPATAAGAGGTAPTATSADEPAPATNAADEEAN